MTGLLQQNIEIKKLQESFKAFVVRKSLIIPSENTVAIPQTTSSESFL